MWRYGARPAPTNAIRDFRQPNRGLHRLNLAEERALAGELILAPVPQQARGNGSHARPLSRQLPPCVHMATDVVDDGHRVVLLLSSGQLRDADLQTRLRIFAEVLRNGGDVLRLPPILDNHSGWPPILIELPMPTRTLVGAS